MRVGEGGRGGVGGNSVTLSKLFQSRPKQINLKTRFSSHALSERKKTEKLRREREKDTQTDIQKPGEKDEERLRCTSRRRSGVVFLFLFFPSLDQIERKQNTFYCLWELL